MSNKCRVRAAAIALLAGLSGCAELTRVTPKQHRLEVAGLELMGAPLDEALARIRAAGFACVDYPRNGAASGYWSKHANAMVREMGCSKASLEIFCPQRRWIVFEYTVGEQRIVYLRPLQIEDKSCF